MNVIFGLLGFLTLSRHTMFPMKNITSFSLDQSSSSFLPYLSPVFITLGSSSYCIDNGNNTIVNSLITLSICSNSPSQNWVWDWGGRLVSAQSSLCLDIQGSTVMSPPHNVTNGWELTQKLCGGIAGTQFWTLTPTHQLESNYTRGKCLTAYGNNPSLQLWDCTLDKREQLWESIIPVYPKLSGWTKPVISWTPLRKNDGSCKFFPDNHWSKVDISALPIHPQSTNLIQVVSGQKKTTLTPDQTFKSATALSGPNTWYWGFVAFGYPLNWIDSTSQPFTVVHANCGSAGTAGLMDYTNSLTMLPVPFNAGIENTPSVCKGSTVCTDAEDRHLTVLDNATCLIHEFWRSSPPEVSPNGTWETCMVETWNMSNIAYPNTCAWMSSNEAGIGVFTGMIRYDEVINGNINHVISMTAPWVGTAGAYPSRFGHNPQSKTNPNDVWFGMRLRVKSSYDCTWMRTASKVICNALKKYGLIIHDLGDAGILTSEARYEWISIQEQLQDINTLPFTAIEVVNTGCPLCLGGATCDTWLMKQCSYLPVSPEFTTAGGLIRSGYNTSLCLTVPSWSRSSGVAIKIQSCSNLSSGPNHQRWIYNTSSETIQNVGSNLCLEFTSIGSSVVQNHCVMSNTIPTFPNSSSQRWKWNSSTKSLSPNINATLCLTMNPTLNVIVVPCSGTSLQQFVA